MQNKMRFEKATGWTSEGLVAKAIKEGTIRGSSVFTESQETGMHCPQKKKCSGAAQTIARNIAKNRGL